MDGVETAFWSEFYQENVICMLPRQNKATTTFFFIVPGDVMTEKKND
jgi:hypothetical protein